MASNEKDTPALALLDKEISSIRTIKSPPDDYEAVAKYRQEIEKIIENAVTTTQVIDDYANKISKKLNDIQAALMKSTEGVQVAIKKTMERIGRNQTGPSLKDMTHLNELLAIELAKIIRLTSLKRKLEKTNDLNSLERCRERLREAIDQCQKTIEKIKSNTGFSLADLDLLKGCIDSWEKNKKISYEQEKEQERLRKEEEARRQKEREESLKRNKEENQKKEEERKKREEEDRKRKQKEDEERKKQEEEEARKRKIEAEEKRKRDEQEQEEKRRRLDPNNWKPIIYTRELDAKLSGSSYHKGICCIVQAVARSIQKEDIQCLASDEYNDISAALECGEKLLSSVITIASQKGQLEFEAPMRAFIPHYPIQDENQELAVKVSVNGSDWVQSSIVQKTASSLTEKNITVSGIELQKYTTAKVVVIAKARSDNLIIDSSGTIHCPKNNTNVKVVIPRDAFVKPTPCNITVKPVPAHIISAIENGSDSYRTSVKAGPIVNVECQTPPKKSIEIDVLNSSDEVVEKGAGKKTPFHMYKTNEGPWIMAKADRHGNSQSVNLPALKSYYSVQRVEAPFGTDEEQILRLANNIYNTMNKTVVRLIVKQKSDNPENAMIQCVRRDLVRDKIEELNQLGYSYGSDTSREFFLFDGQKLCVTFTGNIESAVDKTRQIILNFYAYMDSAKQEVMIKVKDESKQAKLSSYTGNVHCIILPMGSQSEAVTSGEVTVPITLPKKEEAYGGMYGMGSGRRKSYRP